MEMFFRRQETDQKQGQRRHTPSYLSKNHLSSSSSLLAFMGSYVY